jgi:peptidoglycan/LPS O-acetylase OafA/YrhL
MASIKYRPEIDGLRAIAVLSVIFYHARLGLGGGYVGVDIFFVISGYLITSILKKELDQTGKLSLLNFWCRRIRRLLPALSCCVAVVFVLGWFLLLPRDFQRLAQSMASQALLVSNLYFWMRAGYFEASAESKPLLHTWSLSIEEQFYILLPLLLLFCRHNSQRLRRFVILGLAGSFALSVPLTYLYPDAAFYSLPTRAWELLLGCLLALMPVLSWSTGRRNILSFLGLALILGSIVFYTPETDFPGAAALPPCLGCFLIIFANTAGPTPFGRLLGIEPLRRIGLASYSLYLWHWPVLAYAGYFGLLDRLQSRVGYAVVGCLLGWLSYAVVERGSRQSPLLRDRKRAFLFAGTCTVCMVLAGTLTHLGRGMPSRVSPDILAIISVENDRSRFYNGSQVTENGFNVFGSSGSDTRVFLWGDSHVTAVLPCVDAVAAQMNISGLAAINFGTPPCLGFESSEYNKMVFDYVIENDFDKVVLIGRWQLYVDKPGFIAAFRETLEALEEANVEFVVMRQVPELSKDLPRALALARWRSWVELESITPDFETYLSQRQRTQPLFDGWSERTIDPIGVFFPDRDSPMEAFLEGLPVYRDSEHLSGKGSFILDEFVREQVLRLKKVGPQASL